MKKLVSFDVKITVFGFTHFTLFSSLQGMKEWFLAILSRLRMSGQSHFRTLSKYFNYLCLCHGKVNIVH